MPAYYQNEKLFSEIYLEEITAQPEREEVLASLRVLREYRDYAKTDTLNAWVTSYIHEVLAALGFNPVLKTDALTLLNPMGTLDQPVSLCYITLPIEDLDNTTMGRNWAEKVIRSLREQEMQWGLLTNGKLWRIYHLDEPMPYETYLEIDLNSILTDQAKEAYQIFHKFMKAENFVVDENNQCQFDRFKKESKDKVDYIENELQNALKQREEGGQGVLSDICMGYVEELRNAGEVDLDDQDMRQKIYHGAMLYMFRLLFLFYADARGLLSDDNHDLLQQASDKANSLHNGEKTTSTPFSLWKQLEEIFVDIDQTYNGGLFSPQESEFTQFIEETRIKDQYLSPVFHNLTTYKEKDGKKHLISYRDMGVRHLGTLYEGLLEHKLFIAPEDTEVKVTKGKVSFIPVSKGGKLVVGQYLPAGSVYFAGDPSERKSTGSYYTPEYIVDYIVQNTVGEKLNELKVEFLKREKANLKALSMAINEEERKSIASLLEENSLRFVRKEVLQLSVLDPAMGSGHFLVNATNLISNTITELLNDLGIKGETSTGTGYWRRWVVENCIYGVDINPLAVELAKLSLWILSMAKNQPLSFMNHHLKCGNSLVGARLDEIGNYPLSAEVKAPQQIPLFDRDPEFKLAVQTVLEKSNLIATRSSTSLLDVQEKKDWLEEIDQSLAGYKAISNVHTALYFDLKIDQATYNKLLNEKDQNLANSLQKLNRYFHWAFEFPEIFFAHGGFSSVVSNPPYDKFKENDYFQREVAGGSRNFYSHFIAKAIELNKKNGNLGFVVPLSFTNGTSYDSVRHEVFMNYEAIYASHYSKRPNMLFDRVQQRITIFYTKNKDKKGKCAIYTSKLWRWEKSDQEFVVRNPNLSFYNYTSEGILPKLHTEIGAEVYRKILMGEKAMGNLISTEHKNYYAYYHKISMYWIKAYDFIPYFKREGEDTQSISTGTKEVDFITEFDKDLFILLINSSLFYMWWIARSDEFNVLMREIITFNISGYDVFRREKNKVANFVKDLMEDYKENSVIKSTSLGGKKSYYQEFYPRKSVETINRIDDFIAPIFGLNQEQNEFLKTFDIEWRTD